MYKLNELAKKFLELCFALVVIETILYCIFYNIG